MQYLLRVMQSGQAPYALKLEAFSLAEAKAQAHQKGLTVLQAKPAAGMLSKNNSKFPLLLFCQEFKVLLEAGLPMVEVLETLLQKETQAQSQTVLSNLLSQVQSGHTLSQSMAAQPQVFPSLLVASIHAAETTGNLPESLNRYSQYAETVDLLKKRIVSASVYPAIVVTFGLAVLAFLLAYVIPKFANIYATQVKTVSVSTQFVLGLAQFSQTYGKWVLLIIAILIALSIWAFSQSALRAKLAAWSWHWPVVGEKIRLYHLSRFYRTFAMLLKSGLTVSTSLSQINQMLGSSLQINLRQAQQMITEGKNFTHAFEVSGLTTPVAKRLFNVGEKTGTLDQMMDRAASFHEEQMLRWVDKLTKILEPTLMAVIGVLIGGIVLMMYLPIFELASGIG